MRSGVLRDARGFSPASEVQPSNSRSPWARVIKDKVIGSGIELLGTNYNEALGFARSANAGDSFVQVLTYITYNPALSSQMTTSNNITQHHLSDHTPPEMVRASVSVRSDNVRGAGGSWVPAVPELLHEDSESVNQLIRADTRWWCSASNHDVKIVVLARERITSILTRRTAINIAAYNHDRSGLC